MKESLRHYHLNSFRTGNGGRFRSELRYWRGLITLVFHKADTLTVRLILANASILWALGAILEPATFQRHGYELMALIPREIWITAFMLHGLGVYWRVFDPRQRVGWGLAVNAIGLFIWLFTTVLINLSIRGFAIGTSLEIILSASSAWALYRTGLQSEFKLIND